MSLCGYTLQRLSDYSIDYTAAPSILWFLNMAVHCYGVTLARAVSPAQSRWALRHLSSLIFSYDCCPMSVFFTLPPSFSLSSLSLTAAVSGEDHFCTPSNSCGCCGTGLAGVSPAQHIIRSPSQTRQDSNQFVSRSWRSLFRSARWGTSQPWLKFSVCADATLVIGVLGFTRWPIIVEQACHDMYRELH